MNHCCYAENRYVEKKAIVASAKAEEEKREEKNREFELQKKTCWESIEEASGNGSVRVFIDPNDQIEEYFQNIVGFTVRWDLVSKKPSIIISW